MDDYALDWHADIIPGESIAGFNILKDSYTYIKDTLEKLDKMRFNLIDNSDYLEVFSNPLIETESRDLLMSFFFNQNCMLETCIVYITHTGSEYKGKIYGKYGLGDKVSNLNELGSLERDPSGEEFLLMDKNNKCGLSVANGLDTSLEDDPNQNIAIIKLHNLF